MSLRLRARLRWIEGRVGYACIRVEVEALQRNKAFRQVVFTKSCIACGCGGQRKIAISMNLVSQRDDRSSKSRQARLFNNRLHWLPVSSTSDERGGSKGGFYRLCIAD